MIKLNDKGNYNVSISYTIDGKQHKFRRFNLPKTQAEYIEATIKHYIATKDYNAITNYATTTKPNGMTWVELLEIVYQRQWKHNKSDSSYTTAEKLITDFFGLNEPFAITAKDIERITTTYEQRNYSRATTKYRFNVLKVLLKHAGELGYNVTTARSAIPKIKVYQGRIDYLNDKEINKVVTYFSQYTPLKYEVITRLLIETGARPKEILALRAGDTNYNRVTIWESKGDVRRTVLISSGLVHKIYSLKECCAADDRLFPDMCLNKYRRHWQKMLAATDVKPCSVYILRHTAATKLAKNHVPLHIIQQQLGHKSIKTTLKYIHLDTADLNDVAKILATK